MKVFSNCLNGTSAHGLPHLIKPENSKLSKLLWALIIITAMSLFLLHSSTLIVKFSRHDTTISTYINPNGFIFPDVHICRKSFWSKVVPNYFFNINDSDFIRLSKYIANDKDRLFKLSVDGNDRQFSPSIIDKLMMNANYTEFFRINSDAQINGSFMPIKDLFDRVPHSLYHSCYKMKDQFKQLIFESAANLELFVDYQWYRNKTLTDNLMNHYSTFMMRTQADFVGSSYVAIITPKDEYPYVKSYRIVLKRGHHTFAYLKMKHFKKEDSFRHPCRKKYKEVTYLNNLNHKGSVTYKASSIDCAVRLFQEEQLSLHNCLSPLLPIPFDLWKPGFLNYCKFNYRAKYDEVIQFDSMRHSDKKYQFCRQETPCEKTVYSSKDYDVAIDQNVVLGYAEKAYTNFPHIYKDFYNFLHENKTMEEMLTAQESLRNSFTSIGFNVHEYDSLVYEEKFSYEIISLLSDIGGILGFYMGVSLITLMEILAYIGNSFPLRQKQNNIN